MFTKEVGNGALSIERRGAVIVFRDMETQHLVVRGVHRAALLRRVDVGSGDGRNDGRLKLTRSGHFSKREFTCRRIKILKTTIEA